MLVKKDAPLKFQDVGTDYSIQISVVANLAHHFDSKMPHSRKDDINIRHWCRPAHFCVRWCNHLGVAHMHQRPEGRGGVRVFTLDYGAGWVEDALRAQQ